MPNFTEEERMVHGRHFNRGASDGNCNICQQDVFERKVDYIAEKLDLKGLLNSLDSKLRWKRDG